jgi:DNA-binding CsgD family transcriptional regulator
VDSISPGITTALLDPLYEAATQPELWKVFLKRASEALHADKAAILVCTPTRARTEICVDLGLTDELRHDIRRITRSNPWVAEIQKHQDTGWYSGSNDDALSMEAFRKSAFYNESFRKHQIEWVGTALVFGPGGMMPGLCVGRPSTQAPFSVDDKELLRQLVPHLRRAFKAYQAMTSLRDSNAAGQHALDLIGAACITLDSAGLVLSMNRRAKALVASAETLRVKERKLLATLTVEQSTLDACIAPACASLGKSLHPGVGAVVLHSVRGNALYMSVLPYHSSWSFLEDRPAALLFLTTPEEQGHGEHRLWKSMFGLSPAECRVAEMMMHGMEVTEISEAIRIKVDTVRYYQKCVYRKTAVKGQGQLMRLLTRLPSSTR